MRNQNYLQVLARHFNYDRDMVLDEFELAFLSKDANIHYNSQEYGVWSDMGIRWMNIGRYKDANYIWLHMLETIKKYEEKYGERVHKGIPFHNLAIGIHQNGYPERAFYFFTVAFLEDVHTKGISNALNGLAYKAIIQYH